MKNFDGTHGLFLQKHWLIQSCLLWHVNFKSISLVSIDSGVITIRDQCFYEPQQNLIAVITMSKIKKHQKIDWRTNMCWIESQDRSQDQMTWFGVNGVMGNLINENILIIDWKNLPNIIPPKTKKRSLFTYIFFFMKQNKNNFGWWDKKNCLSPKKLFKSNKIMSEKIAVVPKKLSGKTKLSS